MAKVLDDAHASTNFNVLIFGPTGSGKSSFGATAPKPLVLLSEAQGRVSVKQRARMVGRPNDPRVIYMERLQDYRDVAAALHGPKDQPFRIRWTEIIEKRAKRDENGAIVRDEKSGRPVIEDVVVQEAGVTEFEGWWPETVVLDSLTDAASLLRNEIEKDHPLPKDSKTGMRTFTLQHWGILKDRGIRLIRAFRDVPVHTIFLAQIQTKLIETSDGRKTRIVGPEMPGKSLQVPLVQAVNLAGISERQAPDFDRRASKKGDLPVRWQIRCVGREEEQVKPSRPLHDIEVPDFSEWLKRLDLEHGQPIDEDEERAREELRAQWEADQATAAEAGTVIEEDE